MLGAKGVGKTSLILRFLTGSFDTAYAPIIADDYRTVINYNNHNIDITVVDTAAITKPTAPATTSARETTTAATTTTTTTTVAVAEDVRCRRAIINDKVILLLVYAFGEKSSADEVRRLCDEIFSDGGLNVAPSTIIVANKKDKGGKGKIVDAVVNHVDHMDIVGKLRNGNGVIETSAKDGHNVRLLFDRVIALAMNSQTDMKENC